MACNKFIVYFHL